MRFIILYIVFLYSAVGSHIFEKSNKTNPWITLENSCKPADVSLICQDSNKHHIKTCSSDFLHGTDLSRLPALFSAWLPIYLVKSTTIVYKGCFQVSADYLTVVGDRYEFEDYVTCARECEYSQPYIGINNTICYCFSDSVLGHINTLDLSNAIPEKLCGYNKTGNVLRVYKLMSHESLDTNMCPAGYFLDTMPSYHDTEDCDNRNKFYCTDDNREQEAASWNDAELYCSKASSTISNEERGRTQGKYWLHGYQFNDYDSGKQLPLFPTRCGALVRQKHKMSITVVNCSYLLPTLCQKEDNAKVVTDINPSNPNESTLAKTTFSLYVSTSSTTTSAFFTANIPVENMTIGSTKTSTVKTTITMTTSTPNSEPYSIIIPIVVVVIVMVLVLVLVFRKRRSGMASNSAPGHREYGGHEEGRGLVVTQSAPRTPGHETYL